MFSTAFAHSAKVVGDFKIETGWENEPPLVGMDNAIEIIVSLAEESDKLIYDMVFFNKIDDSTDKATEKHLSGLADKIEVNISTGGSKTFLLLEENKENLGVYHAKFVPTNPGTHTIHLYGIIKNLEFEMTSQIEAVKISDSAQIPDWIRNNAKWWSDGAITDADFVKGIQFLAQQGIIKIEQTTESSIVSQEIPQWIRNNAKWWSDGAITDADFVKGIQFLAQQGIIKVS
ncbi:Secreted Zn-dependent protease containing TPR-repeat protein [Nitrosarchaeum koreense MY1]|uniref:Secreted Zn-dependent protease containing TPR-repeat protein n=2 Tax=Nitrosarchaeum TaxID=1007082 RepID=F9CVZ0_9ARCH|nr:Secreted Zn-dependent protease containing TPR-repeat protein [Nitrosarchaeum koreense MY1]